MGNTKKSNNKNHNLKQSINPVCLLENLVKDCKEKRRNEWYEKSNILPRNTYKER